MDRRRRKDSGGRTTKVSFFFVARVISSSSPSLVLVPNCPYLIRCPPRQSHHRTFSFFRYKGRMRLDRYLLIASDLPSKSVRDVAHKLTTQGHAVRTTHDRAFETVFVACAITLTFRTSNRNDSRCRYDLSMRGSPPR